MAQDTNVSTAALRTLHRIHQQLGDLQSRLKRGPNLVKARQNNVDSRKAQLEEAKQQHTTLRMASDSKQTQLKAGEEKIEKLKTQLNTAKSNAEYQGLKDQIAATEMANSVLADEILEGLDKVDQSAGSVKEAEQALAKAEADAEQGRQKVTEEEPRIRADIERLEAELTECEAALPGDFRELYNRVVRAKGQDALAPVLDGSCGGCYQQVPINNINKLMLGEPMFCRGCGRLLYLPEERE
jgi:hypothetical protein